MKVKSVMTRGIEGIQAKDTIRQAAVRMKELDVGSLAVFEGDTPTGMITDRDITIRVVGMSLDPAGLTVGEVMTKEPVTVNENADLADAAQVMENYKIRRLLVKNDHKQISGIITIDDIALRGNGKLATAVIKNVKERIGPRR
ncbi:MAG TPA: CBS domain-containing protein [Chitinivibrionales bacterium]|nr:CBS domain-containing protein [Chitinivibrionales bacterium]